LKNSFCTKTNLPGVPRYQEATPALFAIVSFPFIFGIMYGDVGHGILLLAAGIYCCWVMDAEKLENFSPTLHMARYLLLMMGFFAIYAGIMYNDFFSTGMALFGDSRWQHTPGETGKE
jgi:V-type H+-transporting ATPase subunit a